MASQEEYVELLVDGARYDDADDVDTALAAKVSIDSQDAAGRTGEASARKPAALAGLKLVLTEFLLKINSSWLAALHMAAANGHLGMLEKLLAAGAVSGEPCGAAELKPPR